jgi:hypothetical protein
MICAKRVIFLITVCFFIYSCASTSKREKVAVEKREEPIIVEDSEKIAFHRIIFKVPPGTQIGGHHSGLARIKRVTYTWEAGMYAGAEDYRIAGSEELRNCGYDVLGAENILFGEDDASKARYQLGGTVTDVEYHTYDGLAGNFSEANIKVEWQLYDSFRKEPIYEENTSGYGKLKGVTGGVILSSFRGALRQLLANQEFVDLVCVELAADSEVIAQEDIISIPITASTKELKLPDNLEYAINSTVLMKAGSGHASGVFVSDNGYILTAAHVVSGLEKINIIMNSGIELEAEVIRVNEYQDIALVKVQGRGYPCLIPDTSGITNVGEDIYAIGAPASEDLKFSVAKGIISGYREVEGRKYLQTDTSLNPGNSGGPLINSKGKIVAIVSWKIAAIEYEGLSFGVPINIIEETLGVKWVTQ